MTEPTTEYMVHWRVKDIALPDRYFLDTRPFPVMKSERCHTANAAINAKREKSTFPKIYGVLLDPGTIKRFASRPMQFVENDFTSIDSEIDE